MSAGRYLSGYARERTLYDQLLTRALRLARSTLEELPKYQAFHVEGAASLLHGSAPEGVSLDTLRALLEMMEEKERMLFLLNQYIDGPGLTVVIGAEHSAPGLRHYSLVASTAIDGSTTRTVGGHRSHPHALLARHHPRRRDDPGGGEGPARYTLIAT